MRLSLITVAAVAVAFASCSLAAENEASDITRVLDEETGKYINVFESGGDIDGDDEPAPTRRSNKHHHKSKKSSKAKQHYSASKGPDLGSELVSSDIQVTWYASQDLKRPQCGDGSWSPTSGSHIGAVAASWSGAPKCGDFVQLCNHAEKDNPCVKVRVVDKCAGCTNNWVDLTQSAFKKLAGSSGLDAGKIKDLKMYKSGKPTDWDKALFGPVLLKQ